MNEKARAGRVVFLGRIVGLSRDPPCYWRRIEFLPMASTATPVSAAAEQQH
jgi:hypothetical protein